MYVCVCACVSEECVCADARHGVCVVCIMGVFQHDCSSGKHSALAARPRLQRLHHHHVPVSTRWPGKHAPTQFLWPFPHIWIAKTSNYGLRRVELFADWKVQKQISRHIFKMLQSILDDSFAQSCIPVAAAGMLYEVHLLTDFPYILYKNELLKEHF